MKKRIESREKLRIERILEGDKEGLNEKSKEIALRDLERVACEYFELLERPTLITERDKNGLEVKISFRAARVKNFTSLRP